MQLLPPNGTTGLEKEALDRFVAWGLAEQEPLSLSWAAWLGVFFHEFVSSLLKTVLTFLGPTAHQPVVLNCCLLVLLPAPQCSYRPGRGEVFSVHLLRPWHSVSIDLPHVSSFSFHSSMLVWRIPAFRAVPYLEAIPYFLSSLSVVLSCSFSFTFSTFIWLFIAQHSALWSSSAVLHSCLSFFLTLNTLVLLASFVTLLLACFFRLRSPVRFPLVLLSHIENW